MKDMVTSLGGQRSGERTSSGRRGAKLIRSKKTTARQRVKRAPKWWRRNKRRYGRRSDGLDLPSAHEALRTTRVTREGTAHCFSGDAARSCWTCKTQEEHTNDKVVNIQDEEKGSPYFWFFLAILSAIETTLRPKIDVGKTEAVGARSGRQSRARRRTN